MMYASKHQFGWMITTIIVHMIHWVVFHRWFIEKRNIPLGFIALRLRLRFITPRGMKRT
jgi:hypothetical protein